ncbi:hypothetical protein NHX12_013921, partial [Muraenolepis orangiensis]
ALRGPSGGGGGGARVRLRLFSTKSQRGRGGRSHPLTDRERNPKNAGPVGSSGQQ